jgi:3-deoxy-D-manno-octulosonate 8-phosphate phosphatase (KDO 8-P phosphatase)
MSSDAAIERAKKITILLFDVDGVLTDGALWYAPVPGSGGTSNLEVKGFHAHDGVGMSLARLGGLKLGIITKRATEAVALRARDLKLDYIYQGQDNKVEALEKILAAEKARDEHVAYVGDDIVDVPVLQRVGLAIAPANARDNVKAVVHFVTEHPGGQGAGRDAIEFILRAQGKLEGVVRHYLSDEEAANVAGN